MINLKSILKTRITEQEEDLARVLLEIKLAVEEGFDKMEAVQGSNYKYQQAKICLTKIKKLIEK